MAMGSKTTARPNGTFPWFEIGKFLLIVGLAAAIFLLGLSMVHHRFFRGGYVNPHGVLKP
jgi:hypothetical protein